MAELLVRVIDKTNPDDIYKDVQLTKRGDVIAVQADDWAWSRMEKANPDWRILKWPHLSVSEAEVFLSAQQQDWQMFADMTPDPMLARRGFHLDLDAPGLPAAMRRYLDDSTRAKPAFKVPEKVTVENIKRQKARRANPAVIG